MKSYSSHCASCPLLRADAPPILLIDETRGELRLHQASLFGKFPETTSQAEHISLADPSFHLTVTAERRPFFSDHAADDPQVQPPYRPFIESLQLGSLIGAPLIVRDAGIGEILLGSQSVEFFDLSDMSLVATTASQLAASIERSSL